MTARSKVPLFRGVASLLPTPSRSATHVQRRVRRRSLWTGLFPKSVDHSNRKSENAELLRTLPLRCKPQEALQGDARRSSGVASLRQTAPGVRRLSQPDSRWLSAIFIVQPLAMLGKHYFFHPFFKVRVNGSHWPR